MSDKLFRVEISSSGCYGVYSAAIVQCESREALDNLIETGVFRDRWNGLVDDSRGGFCIESYQTVDIIEHVGDAVIPRKEGKVAAIICSDYVGA